MRLLFVGVLLFAAVLRGQDPSPSPDETPFDVHVGNIVAPNWDIGLNAAKLPSLESLNQAKPSLPTAPFKQQAVVIQAKVNEWTQFFQLVGTSSVNNGSYFGQIRQQLEKRMQKEGMTPALLADCQAYHDALASALATPTPTPSPSPTP